METKTTTAAADARPEAAADPFAVDLFAGDRAHAAASAQSGAEGRGDASAGGGATAAASTPWHASLPRVSREASRFSSMLARLPPSLPARAVATLARVMARYANASPSEVALDVVDVREADLPEWAARRSAEASAPPVFVTLALEPAGARAALEADAVFASALVARTLAADEGAHAEGLGPLSKIELAVVEFLCLCLVRELNEAAGAPVVRLERVATAAEAPPQLDTAERSRVAAAAGGRNSRGLLVAVRVSVGSTRGVVRLLLDTAALAALDAGRNPLLAGTSAGAVPASFNRIVADVPLRLTIGETSVDAADLAGLEPGDVVLLERVFLPRRGARASDPLRVRAGEGRNIYVAGRVAEEGAPTAGEGAGGAAPVLRLLVESVSAEDAGLAEAERLAMQEESEAGAGVADGAGVLEGLLLTVHVELAARRITLDELARLRPGQILELGCRATDPVDLFVDGRRVAAGELVDIEGQLGVRVTEVAG